MQAIYIQQDFIEELLYIFRCGIDKGELKIDNAYKVNRDIRNELVGHPIRKIEQFNILKEKNELVLLSSALFTNKLNSDEITYLRYHKENNYQYELISHTREDIRCRHIDFLNCYFDIILEKQEAILKGFFKKLEEIEIVVDKAHFNNAISIVSQSFETIFDLDPLYKPEILLEIYKKKAIHPRYDNAIKLFLNDLRATLSEKKQSIVDFQQKSYLNPSVLSIENIEIIFDSNVDTSNQAKISYHYEMSKLIDKRGYSDFRFFSTLLRDKCQSKPEVLSELTYMEENRENDLEYFCSYHMIKTLLA